MIKMDIRGDLKAAQKKLEKLSSNLRDKAIARALNKTAMQARAEATREIRKAGYNLRAGDIRKSLSIRKASTRALQASVVSKGDLRLNAIYYNAKQTLSGVRVRFKNKTLTYPHAFFARMRGGDMKVYMRKPVSAKLPKPGRYNRGSLSPRLPIVAVDGPGIPQAFSEKTVNDALQKTVATRFPKILDHEINYLLKTS